MRLKRFPYRSHIATRERYGSYIGVLWRKFRAQRWWNNGQCNQKLQNLFQCCRIYQSNIFFWRDFYSWIHNDVVKDKILGKKWNMLCQELFFNFYLYLFPISYKIELSNLSDINNSGRNNQNPEQIFRSELNINKPIPVMPPIVPNLPFLITG